MIDKFKLVAFLGWLLILCACKSSPDLVGNWATTSDYADTQRTTFITFRQNGSFTSQAEIVRGEIVVRANEKGRWMIIGDTLKMSYDESRYEAGNSDPLSAAGADRLNAKVPDLLKIANSAEPMPITWVSSNEVTLKSPDGSWVLRRKP